jgi:hypothetical protein
MAPSMKRPGALLPLLRLIELLLHFCQFIAIRVTLTIIDKRGCALKFCTVKQGNVLTHGAETDWDFKARDPSELAPSRFLLEQTSLPSTGAKNCFDCGGFACRRRLHLCFACQCSKQRYGGPVVAGDDLAIQSRPRSRSPDRKGDVVALVR